MLFFYFARPKKLLHSNKDETYRQGCHELTGMSQLAEQVVRYDLDDLDVCWLRRVNEEREEIGMFWNDRRFEIQSDYVL